MPRNFSRLVIVLGAAFLAGAPSLHAQSGQPVRGDVDGDGRVTAADARIVSDFLVGKPLPPGANVRDRGDVNGDGRVTSVDAAIIARAAAGRDVSRFPVGRSLPSGAVAVLECTADVRAKSFSCGGPGSAGDARSNIVVGGQNINVKLTHSNLVINLADSTFKFDVTVQNLLKQAMAADSGTGAPSATGVRVFFNAGPTMTEANPSGSGSTIQVLNADGTGTFLASNQRYYEYVNTDLGVDSVLSPGEPSTAHNWQFRFDSGVNKFSFMLYVSTSVQYPQGWVNISPPSTGIHPNRGPDSVYTDTVVAGRSRALTGLVRNAFGGDSVYNEAGVKVANPPVSWSGTSHGRASVDNTGMVTTTPMASGVDSITSTSGQDLVRRGRVVILVVPPSGPNSIITATSPTSVLDSSLVKVQVYDALNRLVDSGGDAVTLSTSLGTLRGTGAAGTTDVVAVDSLNGVYTAWLKNPTTGTANLTGKVNNQPIGNTTSVTFTPGAPALIEKVEPLSTDTVNPGPVDSLPKVRVKDANGNLVPGASVTFSPSPGSNVTGGVQSTNPSGEATVLGWTIGDGLDSLTVTASPGSATAVVFTAYGNRAPVGVRDSIDAIGNVQVTATGLRGNDTDPEEETLSITSLTPNTPTAGGGTVTFTALGGVTYNSAVGYIGLDSVTYTVSDPRGRTATGKLMIRVPDRFWYVSGTGSGSGTQTSPSGNFTFGAALAAKDSIFLLSSATVGSGVTLLNGGALIGAGAATISRTLFGSANMTVNPVTLLTNGSAPTLTVSAGTGVSLAAGGSGYIVKGLSLVTSAGAGISSGSGFGTLDLGTNELSITSTGGAALTLTTGALSGTMGTLSSSGATGLSLTTVTGSLSATGGTLTGSASGPAVNVSGGSVSLTYAGSLAQTANNALVSVNGVVGHTGTLTFNTGTVTANNGSGLQFDNADGTYAFNNGLTFTVGGDAGIDVLNNSGGTFTFPVNSSISNPTGEAIRINASTASLAFTYLGGILKNNGSTGITVSSNAGGTISFGSRLKSITSTGSNVAVNLTTNGTATITSLDSLVIGSASGAGFNATGGGTVSVQGANTGANNSVNSTAGGTAVNISGTTIAGSGIAFKSVNATGSGTNGIVLSNTGSGPFTVTGDGASDVANTTRGRTTAKSGGGVLALNSGGTISGRTGDGINLSTTGAVTLRNLLIQNGTGDGIDATSVSGGLIVDNTRITGHAASHGLHATSVAGVTVQHSELASNATSSSVAAPNITNLRFDNVTGTATVQNSTVQTAYEHVWTTLNSSGALTLNVTNNLIGGGQNGDGVQIYAYGSSSVTANLQTNTLDTNFSFALDSGTETGLSGTLNLTVNNNQFTNNFVGMAVAHGSSGTNTFNVTNNNFQANTTSSSSAINVNRLGGGAFTSFGLFSGTVSGNTIGTSGVANSGSQAGDGITVKTNGNGGTTRVSILNNTIRRYGQHGIMVIPRDANTGHTLHARIQGNNIAEGLAALSLDGINVTMGALNTDVISLCLDIGGGTAAVQNTVSSAVRNGIRVRSSGLPAANVTLTMPSYDGTGATYIANRNPAATGAVANTSFSNASGTSTAGACTTP